jgi:hypothetical protein
MKKKQKTIAPASRDLGQRVAEAVAKRERQTGERHIYANERTNSDEWKARNPNRRP